MPQADTSTFDVFSRICLLYHTSHFGTLSYQLLKTFWDMGLLPGIEDTELHPLAHVASLHDIGKCALSEQIVHSPATLSPLEYEIMKQHTTLGAMFFDMAFPEHRNDRLLAHAREITLCHHERWDGSGYPAGLKGAEIPAYVQVISLADAYDALMTTRSYRPSFSHAEAIKLIRSGGCGEFQPQMLNVFLAEIERIAGPLYSREQTSTPALGPHYSTATRR